MMLLPQGRTFAIDPGYASASWTKPVQALYVDSTLVRAALMANCLLRMGIETGDRWMIEESFRLYLNALRAIRNTLKTPKRALSDETLAAIKLMMMFEVRHCNMPCIAGRGASWLRARTRSEVPD